MGWLQNIFDKNSDIRNSLNIEIPTYESNRAYLKEMALETCISFIARAFSQSEFMIMDNKKRVRNDWDYLFNVRPNTDQSAADFWQRFVHTLINQNEVLVVITDTNDLLIADSFYREEFAIYPDKFSNVVVKDYEFKRTFNMDEVIYINYNNERLERFLDGLMKDYGELFGRMMEASQRAYQIRALVNLEASHGMGEEAQGLLQDFVDRAFSAIKKSAVALIPVVKGLVYNEVSSGDKKGPSTEEIDKLKRSITDSVAEILGIPTALIHGEMANSENNTKSFIKLTLNPLIKKVNDELNAKIIDKKAYQKGMKITVQGIRHKDTLELAVSIDKLVASGVFTRNEVREISGYERVDNPELDEYLITKNYAKAGEESKGGEE